MQRGKTSLLGQKLFAVGIQQAERDAIQNKSTDIKNLVGYLIEAVREDYEAPSVKRAKSSNSFNQFKQNSYDFDELEKSYWIIDFFNNRGS